MGVGSPQQYCLPHVGSFDWSILVSLFVPIVWQIVTLFYHYVACGCCAREYFLSEKQLAEQAYNASHHALRSENEALRSQLSEMRQQVSWPLHCISHDSTSQLIIITITPCTLWSASPALHDVPSMFKFLVGCLLLWSCRLIISHGRHTTYNMQARLTWNSCLTAFFWWCKLNS